MGHFVGHSAVLVTVTAVSHSAWKGQPPPVQPVGLFRSTGFKMLSCHKAVALMGSCWVKALLASIMILFFLFWNESEKPV
jgi:hypothetical protein